MLRTLLLIALLACGGCRMCSDCCDYGPAVTGGPPLGTARAGSALGGMYVETAPAEMSEPIPAVASGTPFTPIPAPLVR